MADSPSESPQLQSTSRTSAKGAKSGNGKCILSESDPLGFKIGLGLDTWESHICAGHPEMANKLDIVKRAIREPQIVTRSISVPTTYFYYRLTGMTEFRRDDLYVVVVVHKDDATKNGLIKTAHLVDKVRNKENAIWVSRN